MTTLGYLQIIGGVWLWVMLGLWGCERQLCRWGEIKLLDFIFWMITAPIIPIGLIFTHNPVIWRKRE